MEKIKNFFKGKKIPYLIMMADCLLAIILGIYFLATKNISLANSASTHRPEWVWIFAFAGAIFEVAALIVLMYGVSKLAKIDPDHLNAATIALGVLGAVLAGLMIVSNFCSGGSILKLFGVVAAVAPDEALQRHLLHRFLPAQLVSIPAHPGEESAAPPVGIGENKLSVLEIAGHGILRQRLLHNGALPDREGRDLIDGNHFLIAAGCHQAGRSEQEGKKNFCIHNRSEGLLDKNNHFPRNIYVIWCKTFHGGIVGSSRMGRCFFRAPAFFVSMKV